jgi:hypothetical protein
VPPASATGPPTGSYAPRGGSDGGRWERGGELRSLTSALDAAAAGRGAAVVVEGPAGIGKTRLLDATRDLAKERGFGRLHAIGDEAERALPWAVVRQLVERSTSRYAGGVRDAILADPPDERCTHWTRRRRSAGDDEAAFARTLHALWWVAVDLSSSRPLLISVDDAQWADLASQRFLVYLARRISDLPVALVVGTRPPPSVGAAGGADGRSPGDVPHPQAAVAGCRRGADAALRRAGAPQVVAAVHVAAGGNPFLTGQLLHELAVRRLDLTDPATAPLVPALAPQTVSRALLAGLSDQAAALAGAAAVLGARCDLERAATLAHLDPGPGAALRTRWWRATS